MSNAEARTSRADPNHAKPCKRGFLFGMRLKSKTVLLYCPNTDPKCRCCHMPPIFGYFSMQSTGLCVDMEIFI